MKKVKILSIFVILLFGLIPMTPVLADEEIIIFLENDQILLNNENITKDNSKSLYLSNKTNNGGTEKESQKANIKIDNVINISQKGTYVFSGNLENGQIAVNANNIDGEVNIVLNNVSIKCEDAPAILIYSKNIEDEKCKVTITLKENSKNTITGGRIKQSVQDWKDQENILYYIEKGYEKDKSYYENYKYDGAISSDISLNFDGTGFLTVNGIKKEGIESKKNITFNGGNYNIFSEDDGINACYDNKSLVIINDANIVINVSKDAEEGDGIDSNGSIKINGGIIYTFACPGSDNGLDSDLGIDITGGTILSTGDMFERISSSNNTNIVQMNFSQPVNEGDTILILDENQKEIFAYKTDRKICTFTYTTDKLESNYTVYTGTEISGIVDENNIYTRIDSFDLEKLTKQENTGNNFRKNTSRDITKENSYEKERIESVVMIGLLIIIAIIIFIINGKKSNKKE